MGNPHQYIYQSSYSHLFFPVRFLLTAKHNKVKFKICVIIFFTGIMSSCGPSTGAYTGLFAGEAVSSVVDNFGNRIEGIINQLDGVISKRSFDIRQHLMLLGDQLDYIVGKNIDKTFDRLDEQQRQLLLSIDYALNEFENTSDVTLGKIDCLCRYITRK